jgi:CPA1 family monovalent cation:H+ antiporter
MDLITTISVVAALTGILSWMSLRWLKATTIGVPLFTVVGVLIVLAAGSQWGGIRQSCADLASGWNAPQFFSCAVVPLLLFTSSTIFDPSVLGRRQLLSAGGALFRGVLTAFGVAGIMSYISKGTIAWSECLLFGSLISATDTIAQARLLSGHSASEGMRQKLTSESMINSAFAAALFIAIVQFRQFEMFGVWTTAILSSLEAGGGVFLGIIAGWVAARALDGMEDQRTRVLVVGTLVVISVLTTRHFGLAGPLEAVSSGLAFRRFSRPKERRNVQNTASPAFWNAIADIENSALFVLLGIWVAANGLSATALTAGLVAILATILLRLVSTSASFLLKIRPRHLSPLLLAWGGFRGGIAIALALAVPYPASGSWIRGATFIAVAFSVLVQGPTIGWLRRLSPGTNGQPHLIQN